MSRGPRLVAHVMFVPGGKPMSPVVEGFGTEITQRTYPSVGTPLLQTFYLRFTDSDRHIDAIGVEVEVPDDNRLTIEYYDESRNDRYYYRVQHLPISDNRIQANKVTSIAKAREVFDLQKPPGSFTFVLSGFTFYFRGSDQHVDQVQILERSGRLYVAFNDDDDKETFLWRAEYAWLPDDLIAGTRIEEGVRARGGARRAIPRGMPLIQGFAFDFRPYFTGGEDHHLQEIGVLTRWPSNDFLEVYYADKNGDDGFDWQVRLAYLDNALRGGIALPETVGVIETE